MALYSRCALLGAAILYGVIGSVVVHAQDKGGQISVEDIERAEFGEKARSVGKIKPWMVRAQVLLDRARISPGVIDGYDGDNFRNALKEFQRRNGLEPGGKMDGATWERLTATSSDPTVTEYEITADDLKGPFTAEMPAELEDKAKLDRLGYRDPKEELAERFHMDEDLLQALNSGKDLAKAGEKILVVNVLKNKAKAEKVARIEVDKKQNSLRAYDEKGEVVAFYPATIGSEEKPAPTGTVEVTTVAENPTWSYNPDFKFKNVKTDKPVTLKAGPNNPVGSTWIDLTAETYGIHGTPEPSKVGKSESHGCVRLTNWDVETLAHLVQKGTKVEFLE